MQEESLELKKSTGKKEKRRKGRRTEREKMMMKRKSDPKDVFKDALGPRTKATYTHTGKKKSEGVGKYRWGALLHVCLPCVC